MSGLELRESKQYWSKVDAPTLAIDFGERRLGIAVSDSRGVIGSPLGTIVRGKRSDYTEVIREIGEIAEEHGIKSILIGLPQSFAPSHEKIRGKILRFAEILYETIPLTMYYVDESFSSDVANNILSQEGRVDQKSGRVDKVSAALFLQQFLDETNKTKPTKQGDS